MPPRTSPLYSTVVLAGVALTAGAAACGDDSPGGGDAAIAETGSDSNATGDSSVAPDGKAPADAGCPPDSEVATPPCAFIL